MRRLEVSQKELAQCLGISTRQVRNLKSEGLFQLALGERKYHLEECVREYIDFKINAEMGRRASISKEQVQAEHEEVKKQISLLKLRKLRRELHEAGDVEYFLSDMLIRFKNRLMSIPAKLALVIAGETDINKLMVLIQNELLDALEELSEYNADEIDQQTDQDTYLDEEELDESEDEDEE
ncbi:DNA-packaging protein [Eisenbergiella tayi]|uniref:DNA-packaging protein n=1 Tax=Eisenbergiella tayi TaxID=1432052 RepID=UPI001FA71624